jgi:predicted secreted hydrolase
MGSVWRRLTGRFIAAVGVLSIALGLAASATAAAVATVQPVVLPADQGAHPQFGIEWWYTSGTLTGAHRRPYFWFATIWSSMGALVARVNIVDLLANRVMLSHSYVALTPPAQGQSQFTVGAFNLGLQADGGWAVGASTPAGSFQLNLIPRQPYMLHGQDGIIQQGTGGPSAYYSAPRLAARGKLVLHGRATPVSGQGWLDHQWGNFGMNVGALKWNWFACQFRNGSDLMLYQFLNQSNRPSGLQTGTLLRGGGADQQLTRFTITPIGRSIRPAGATTTYPLAWRLQVPGSRIDITIRARARNQFITNQFVPSFWEAASSITSGATGSCTVESSREVPTGPM